MSLETEKQLFIDTMVKAFNKQYGTAFLGSNMNIVFNHPNEEMAANIVIATKLSTDNFRIRADVREIGKNTSFGPFQLKVKNNFGSGSLDDEIYVTVGTLHENDFKAFSSHLKSKNFKTFTSTPKRIMTMSGNYIQAMSGVPIQTQQ